jgi:chaperonin GroEL (HSP60 family)
MIDERERRDAALEEAREEFIANRIAELIDTDEFALFVECDQKAADAIRKLCRASTSMELNEAQAEINDMIRSMANVVAERDWKREEPRVFFQLQEAA